MQYTQYQLDIFKEIEKRGNGQAEGNLIIQACPGGSKTTTIIEACKHIPDWQKVILLSFNKHIAMELEQRLNKIGCNKVESSTLNALGWRSCRANVKNVKLDSWKDINILRGIMSYERGQTVLVKDLAFEKIKWVVNRLIGLCKAYVVTESSSGGIIKQMREIAETQGIEIPNTQNFDDIFEQCYKKSINEINIMSFDDQLYMPIYQGWEVGSYNFSMVDESQDLSLMNMELIKKLGGIHIFVGDKNQACYLFRGASGNSMDIIKKEFDCRELPLSICFRCPELVIQEAQKIYPDAIECPTKYGMINENGIGIVETVGKDIFRKMVEINDFVLCRTNAPLIKECLKMLPYKACYVRGREIGEGLIKLIDIVMEGKSINGIVEFGAALTDYSNEIIGRLNGLNKEMEAANLQDQVESLHAFMVLVNNVEDLKRLIEKVIPSKDGDNNDRICFMSLHRSKGLETKNVWILRRDLIPFVKAKTEEQIQQEWNLLFIGITRSRMSLRYVEKERGEK